VSPAASHRVPRRIALLPRLGLRPATADVLASYLDAVRPSGARAAALDAGCGRMSALAPRKDRLERLIGVDIHQPPSPLPWLDAFRIADVCRDGDAFEAGSFDLILSSFTVEHFAEPPAAFRNLARWLRPGGTLVLSTVNRAHPFVGLYLSLPSPWSRRLQRLVKASAADAHPLVGRCNTPALLREGLRAAGFEDVTIQTTGHLARAWQRHLPTFLLGLLGDLAAQPFPERRSTIVARARLHA
jgi:SAM-dependent methyltransferase